MVDYKKHNITIIDDTNINQLLKIDKRKPSKYDYNYYELIESNFIYGRLIYNKFSGNPLFYWFCKEELDNYSIICWNSLLQNKDSTLIMVGIYRQRCIETGNTLTFAVEETDLDTCNFLKTFMPKTKIVAEGIEFKFFNGYREDWLDKELHVKIYKEHGDW